MDFYAIKERLERLQAQMAPHEDNWDHIASSPDTATSAANLMSALEAIDRILDSDEASGHVNLAETSILAATSDSRQASELFPLNSNNDLSNATSAGELSSRISYVSTSTNFGGTKGSVETLTSTSSSLSLSNDEVVASPAALSQPEPELSSLSAPPLSPTFSGDFFVASSQVTGGLDPDSEESNGEWECKRCTLINTLANVSCVMCDTRRPKARQSPKQKKVESTKDKVPSRDIKSSSKSSKSDVALSRRSAKSKKRMPLQNEGNVQWQLDMIETCIECGKSTSNPGEEYTVLRCGRTKKCIRETHLHCSGHTSVPKGHWLCRFCSQYFYSALNNETLEKIASKKGLNVEVLVSLNYERFADHLTAKTELRKNTDILLQAPPPKSFLKGIDFETGYPDDEAATTLEELPEALERAVPTKSAKKRSRYIDSSGSEEENANDLNSPTSGGSSEGNVLTHRLEAPAVRSSSPSSPDDVAPIVMPLPVPRWGPKPWGDLQWSGEAELELVTRCRAGNASGVAALLAEAADVTCHGTRGVQSAVTWLCEAAGAMKPDFSGLTLVHHAMLCTDSSNRPATLAALLSFGDKHFDSKQRAAVLTLPTKRVTLTDSVAASGGSATAAETTSAPPVTGSTPLHLCAAASDEACARMIIAASLRWGLLALALDDNVDLHATPVPGTTSTATDKEGISVLGGWDSLGQSPCAVALKHHGNVNLMLHLAGLKLCKGTQRTWSGSGAPSSRSSFQQVYVDLLMPLDREGNDACALLAVAITNSSNGRISNSTPVAAMAKMVRAIEMAQPHGDENATAAPSAVNVSGEANTSEDLTGMTHQSTRLKLVHNLERALAAVATCDRHSSELSYSEWGAAAAVWRVLLPRLPMASSMEEEGDQKALKGKEVRHFNDVNVGLRQQKLSDPIQVAIAARDFELLGLAIPHRDRPARTVTTSPLHLHLAVSYGWVEGAALLLSRGCADPNAADASGCTPLMLAIDIARGGEPSSALTPSEISRSCELGSRGGNSRSSSSSSKRRCCEDAIQGSTLLPAMSHSMVALFLQQDALDLAAADACGRTSMHRLFAPHGCPGYSSGNLPMHVTDQARAELLGIVLASPSHGTGALEVALTDRCNGTTTSRLSANSAMVGDVDGTVGHTAAELLRMPPDGCSTSEDDESIGCVHWQRVDELLEKFETSECIALSAQTERPSKEGLRMKVVEVLPRERFGISATPFASSQGWGNNAEGEVSAESLGNRPQPQGSLRVTTTLAMRTVPAKKKRKKGEDSQPTKTSLSTSATSATLATATTAPLPTIKHDFVYLASSVPSSEVDVHFCRPPTSLSPCTGVSIEDSATKAANGEFTPNASIGRKDFVPESGSLLQRFSSATIEGLAAIIYSKVAPKKAESRAGAFKMVPVSSKVTQAQERQKAQEDAEENTLLYEAKLFKVDDALWHLADNCSSSGSSSGSSSSSASSSACSSSSSSESATSSTNSGLCVRVRCFGQLLRRSAIRFREAGAFIGETSTEDGQLMWNALKPGGLASIDRGGGIMKSSKASLLHVSSSSGLHVPAREWVSLLYKVLEWPCSSCLSRRYSEEAAASAVVKLLLGLDERINAKVEAFSDGWARNPVMSPDNNNGSSPCISYCGSDDLVWSERECWAGGLRALLDTPSFPFTTTNAKQDEEDDAASTTSSSAESANDRHPGDSSTNSHGMRLLPLTLGAVEPFLMLFLERCPSPRTHDTNWKRHRSHALYEQSQEGPWKASKLRSKVVECSWCSDCNPDSCTGNLLQRGPRIAQPPLEVFWCGPDKGFGVRSPVDLPQHAFVCEYVGEIFDTKKDGGAREYRYALEKRMQYILPLGDSTASMAIDATLMGNVARFLNHSCAPNVYKVEVSGDRADKRNFRVAFFTSMPVEAGVELTWSYGKTYGSRKTDKLCHCGAPGCHGKMP